jgi:molybdate transport system regulatory protein
MANNRAKPKRPRTPARAGTPPMSLRAKLWVESAGQVALTEAGADLLEQIDAHQSLSEAARRLRFSYRRAWMLLDAMNRRWPKPLVRTAIGGKHGGGARLTELGRHVLRAYRAIQLEMENLLSGAGNVFEMAGEETKPI